jgi:MFS family permease
VDPDADALTGRQRLLAYASGGFGLSMNAQLSLLVPLQARDLGAGFDEVGLIVGLGSLVAAVFSVPMGAVVDRLGPRRCFVLGTGSCAVLSTLYMVPASYWWFLAFQPVLAVSRTFGWVASQAYITNIGPAGERSVHTGRFSLCSNLGQLAGPLLAGAAAQWVGVRWALAVPAAYSCVFLVNGLLLPRISVAGGHVPGGFGLVRAVRLLREPALRFVMTATFARIWVTIIFTTFLPLLLADHGVAPGLIGVVMSLTGVVATVVAPTAGFLARWTGSERLVATASVGCGAAALLLTPLLAGTPLVIVLPCLVGIGVGLSLPMLMSIVAGSAPPGSLGVAMGLRSLANQGASTSGPLVVGPMIGLLGVVPGFAVGGLVAGAVLVAAYTAVARREGKVQSQADLSISRVDM